MQKVTMRSEIMYRAVVSRFVLPLMIGIVAVALIAGCTSQSADTSDSGSATPTNVLPEEGSPIVYEFYTET